MLQQKNLCPLYNVNIGKWDLDIPNVGYFLPAIARYSSELHSPVDDQMIAGHIRRCIRSQKQYPGGDLIRPADPAERTSLFVYILALVGGSEFLRHFGFCEPGIDGVDPKANRPELLAKVMCQ